MATCHSLRVVDDELLGDPLDVKMFEFTGWSFEELAQKTNLSDREDDQNSPSSISRPPAGREYSIGEEQERTPVRNPRSVVEGNSVAHCVKACTDRIRDS